MRLRKQLAFAVEFANFCHEMGIEPLSLASIIRDTEMSVKCYERGNSEGEKQHAENAEAEAEQSGLEIDWPGLYPCVQKTGKLETNRMLPMPD